MNTSTTYIAEVDPEFAEMHELVTNGGNTDKRAWFALELAMSDVDGSEILSAGTAMYIMGEYIGSTKFRNYDHMVDTIQTAGYLGDDTAAFLKSGFEMSDDVICHCEQCA
jgi:hypothetical protein